MRRDLRQTAPRRWARIGAALVFAACVPVTQAGGYGSGYSDGYYSPHDAYGFHENYRLRREMNDLNDQVRRQQRLLDEQVRQQKQQTQLLRQQKSAIRRDTARQACYYRLEGGLDLCDRLFDAASQEHAACVETVEEMNPGCAADLAGPAIR